MAYELKITPSRGSAVLNPLQDSGFVAPSNKTGIKSSKYKITQSPAFVVNGNNNESKITFNNSNLSSVTSITVTADLSASYYNLPYYDVGEYIQTINSNNFTELALYKITSLTTASDNSYKTLGVNYINSTVNTFLGGKLLACPRLVKDSFVEYCAYANSPLYITGSLDSINGILQNLSYLRWRDEPNTWDVEFQSGVKQFKNLRREPQDTSDVIISLNIKKNGVAHQDFDLILKYQTKSQKANPGGLPSGENY